MTDTLLQARDRMLYSAITDCGGGGLSSAFGEMGEDVGLRIDLDKVPLKYSGLAPYEIWISEAQERMALAVPPENVDELLEIFQSEDVEATVIGEFTGDRKLRLFYEEVLVADLDMEFLHTVPRQTLKAVWKRPIHPEPNFADPDDLTSYLLEILSSPNVASKEWVIRQYDHEVQGGSVLKPLQGVENDGPGDACIATPVLGSKRGIIVANGINPKYSDTDPYDMAASAIDEALRNIISVGGTLERIALLDNFSWGNPDKPDRLGALVRACKACYDIAKAFGTPFISGKDSLNNEYRDTQTGEQIAIPHTLLISAICVMDDVTKAVSMDAKSPGDLVYVVGKTYNEMGGSHYYAIRGFIGNDAPKVRPREGKRTMEAVSEAIENGLVVACHDCSEGGIGVAAAEMAFAGGYGMTIDLSNIPKSHDVCRNDALLFSESNSRFIVEVPKKFAPAVEKRWMSARIDLGCIGEIRKSKIFEVIGLDGQTVISVGIEKLKSAWQGTFDW